MTCELIYHLIICISIVLVLSVLIVSLCYYNITTTRMYIEGGFSQKEFGDTIIWVKGDTT